MKIYRQIVLGLSGLLLMVEPVFAVDTTQTYSSGILVLLFLAFCALVIVVQLMPTIMLLFGFVKGLIKGRGQQVNRNRS